MAFIFEAQDSAGPARVIIAISLRVYSRCRSPKIERSRTNGWQVFKTSCR